MKKTSVPKKTFELGKITKTEEKSSVPKRNSFNKKQNLFVSMFLHFKWQREIS